MQTWKTALIVVMRAAFVLLFADVVAAAVSFGIFWKGGALVRGGHQIATITNHGAVRWVTPEQAHLYHALLSVMFVGVPIFLMLAFVLELGLGVAIFGETVRMPPGDPRTLSELRRRRFRLLLPAMGAVGGFVVAMVALSPWLHPLLLVAFLVAWMHGCAKWSERIWRCPSCEADLGKSLNPDACPACGASLTA